MHEGAGDAPGRVNLIGEHTDYQDGYVLPCAVPQRTRVVLNRRADRVVTATSAEPGFAPVTFTLGGEARRRDWGDYVQGLTWVVGGSAFSSGFDLRISSDVPVGSGLSSSAALEVAALRAMREAFGWQMSDVDLAKTAQRAEVEFVGAPVGIMDQMASSLALEREALFLDTRSLAFERIPLPSTLDLVVIDSRVAHRHAGGEYRERRRESEEAAALLGVTRLRDAGLDRLSDLDRLPPVLARRARHIITENARVLEARAALQAGDLRSLGELFNASHASLRDDYEVSVPALDKLVALAQGQPQVFGARMTGGGFGGSIVAAVAAGSAASVSARVSAEYANACGTSPAVLLPPK